MGNLYFYVEMNLFELLYKSKTEERQTRPQKNMHFAVEYASSASDKKKKIKR